ncbi:hypothetical protein L249_3633 [Ophiocordyceps polyrhachis-furcata BCC 54312]|uniref:Uncharacterized protein n=1 Tax=Ophiocordyceps polyrhachis-furcata BCC 54312 TaxID=1330021 RepID=A0A367KZH9_9HYPO|nr:hypothetical protein L249_3633 [Ophiocordyceps polyrhachis-furcata BCC 54312]
MPGGDGPRRRISPRRVRHGGVGDAWLPPVAAASAGRIPSSRPQKPGLPRTGWGSPLPPLRDQPRGTPRRLETPGGPGAARRPASYACREPEPARSDRRGKADARPDMGRVRRAAEGDGRTARAALSGHPHPAPASPRGGYVTYPAPRTSARTPTPPPDGEVIGFRPGGRRSARRAPAGTGGAGERGVAAARWETSQHPPRGQPRADGAGGWGEQGRRSDRGRYGDARHEDVEGTGVAGGRQRGGGGLSSTHRLFFPPLPLPPLIVPAGGTWVHARGDGLEGHFSDPGERHGQHESATRAATARRGGLDVRWDETSQGVGRSPTGTRRLREFTRWDGVSQGALDRWDKLSQGCPGGYAAAYVHWEKVSQGISRRPSPLGQSVPGDMPPPTSTGTKCPREHTCWDEVSQGAAAYVHWNKVYQGVCRPLRVPGSTPTGTSCPGEYSHPNVRWDKLSRGTHIPGENLSQGARPPSRPLGPVVAGSIPTRTSTVKSCPTEYGSMSPPTPDGTSRPREHGESTARICPGEFPPPHVRRDNLSQGAYRPLGQVVLGSMGGPLGQVVPGSVPARTSTGTSCPSGVDVLTPARPSRLGAAVTRWDNLSQGVRPPKRPLGQPVLGSMIPPTSAGTKCPREHVAPNPHWDRLSQGVCSPQRPLGQSVPGSMSPPTPARTSYPRECSHPNVHWDKLSQRGRRARARPSQRARRCGHPLGQSAPGSTAPPTSAGTSRPREHGESTATTCPGEYYRTNVRWDKLSRGAQVHRDRLYQRGRRARARPSQRARRCSHPLGQPVPGSTSPLTSAGTSRPREYAAPNARWDKTTCPRDPRSTGRSRPRGFSHPNVRRDELSRGAHVPWDILSSGVDVHTPARPSGLGAAVARWDNLSQGARPPSRPLGQVVPGSLPTGTSRPGEDVAPHVRWDESSQGAHPTSAGTACPGEHVAHWDKPSQGVFPPRRPLGQVVPGSMSPPTSAGTLSPREISSTSHPSRVDVHSPARPSRPGVAVARWDKLSRLPQGAQVRRGNLSQGACPPHTSTGTIKSQGVQGERQGQHECATRAATARHGRPSVHWDNLSQGACPPHVHWDNLSQGACPTPTPTRTNCPGEPTTAETSFPRDRVDVHTPARPSGLGAADNRCDKSSQGAFPPRRPLGQPVPGSISHLTSTGTIMSQGAQGERQGQHECATRAPTPAGTRCPREYAHPNVHWDNLS